MSDQSDIGLHLTKLLSDARKLFNTLRIANPPRMVRMPMFNLFFQLPVDIQLQILKRMDFPALESCIFSHSGLTTEIREHSAIIAEIRTVIIELHGNDSILSVITPDGVEHARIFHASAEHIPRVKTSLIPTTLQMKTDRPIEALCEYIATLFCKTSKSKSVKIKLHRESVFAPGSIPMKIFTTINTFCDVHDMLINGIIKFEIEESVLKLIDCNRLDLTHVMHFSSEAPRFDVINEILHQWIRKERQIFVYSIDFIPYVSPMTTPDGRIVYWESETDEYFDLYCKNTIFKNLEVHPMPGVPILPYMKYVRIKRPDASLFIRVSRLHMQMWVP